MTQLNKLVRDKVPSLVTKDGGSYSMNLLTPEEHLIEVKKKLLEETKEFAEATSRNQEVDELIDVAELVYTALKLHNLSIEEFEQLRQNKRKIKGGFENGIYLTSISN